jgi:hypothetical protein
MRNFTMRIGAFLLVLLLAPLDGVFGHPANSAGIKPATVAGLSSGLSRQTFELARKPKGPKKPRKPRKPGTNFVKG